MKKRNNMTETSITHQGAKYIGIVENGKGVLHGPYCYSYSGEVKDGHIHGFGRLEHLMAYGSNIQEGEWRHGQMHGKVI